MADGITISTNMNLPIPAAGVTPGPEWFTSIVQCLNIIDQHDHSFGKGVQINTGGISFLAALSMNNNPLTNASYVQFTPGSPVALDAVYVSGVDLFYNDGNGNAVRITSGGAVNATSSGISSGTATASFVASVLVVNAATNTPANVQAASFLFGNNVANSKYLTLSPPNAMAANYQLFLPSLPLSTLPLTLDTSGNIVASVLTRAMLATPGQGASSATSTTINLTTLTAICNTGAFTTVGGPVLVTIQGNPGYFTAAGGSPIHLQILRDATPVYDTTTTQFSSFSSASVNWPAAFSVIDTGATAGSHTYTLKASAPNTGSGASTTTTIVLSALEIR